MSSCLSGGRAYRLELELVRSPSTSWTSHSSSSPSFTLSESSNSPVTITTRKPRTPRKRPNQKYNEAAAILSSAYPKVFPHKQLRVPRNFRKTSNPFAYEVQDLLLPFQIQLHHPSRIQKLNICNESKVVNFDKCFGYGDEYREDFDAESILDGETEESIDSIMGDIVEDKNAAIEEYKNGPFFTTQILNMNTCYGYPVGMGHYGTSSNFNDNYGNGLRREAFRNGNDQFDYWGFSSVNVADITPEFNKSTSDKKKKKKVDKSVELMKKKNLMKKVVKEEEDEDVIIPKQNAGLLLKLDYDNVLNAWSDKSTPLPEELLSSDDSANDVQMRLLKIDLFEEGGGIREASVMRYKEKRQTRHFSKKIRYQVRKANADQRPRMKGRFVRRPGSPGNDHQ